MQTGRKVAFVVGSNVAGAVLGYGALLVIGRAFDPAAYGSFVFASSVGGLFALATTLGLGAAHQRLVARGVPHRTVMGTAARLRFLLLLGGVALLLAAFAAVRVLRGPVLTDATSTPVLAGAVLIQVLGMARVFLAETWIGLQEVTRPEATRLLDAALYLALLANAGVMVRRLAGDWTPLPALGDWWASRLGFDAPLTAEQAALLLVLCALAGKAVSLLVGLVLAARSGLGLGPYDKAVARELWRFGLPLALSAAIGLIVAYTDVFLLGFFWTAREAGLYGTAQRLVVLVALAAGAASGVLFSRFAQLNGAGDAAGETRLQRESERWLLVVSVPVAAGFLALASPAIHVAVGDGYLQAADALGLLALATLAYVVQVPAMARFMGHGLTRAALAAGAVNATTNVAFNLVLVPKSLLALGIVGAAASTLASNVLAYLVLAVLANRRFGTPVVPSGFVPIALAAGAVGVGWWQLARRWPDALDRAWELGTVGVLGLLVYGLLLLAMRVVRRDDVAWLGSLLKPIR